MEKFRNSLIVRGGGTDISRARKLKNVLKDL